MNTRLWRMIRPCFLLSAICIVTVAQETLTDESLMRMVKAGVSETVIVAMVNQQPGNYSAKVDDLIALKQAGVSDKVVAAMLTKVSGGASTTSPLEPAAETSPNPAFEIGVYYHRGNTWVEVLPEIVNWRTGGAIKNLASVGVVKKDVNGNISGSVSRNTVRSPLEFMIVTPDGVSITEYQLIRLHQGKDYREFRTVTGGVFNQQSGALRDLVTFDGKKIAPRTYSVYLPDNLGVGEYGFLVPGAFGASGNSQAQIGKMHTFRIPE